MVSPNAMSPTTSPSMKNSRPMMTAVSPPAMTSAPSILCCRISELDSVPAKSFALPNRWRHLGAVVRVGLDGVA